MGGSLFFNQQRNRECLFIDGMWQQQTPNKCEVPLDVVGTDLNVHTRINHHSNYYEQTTLAPTLVGRAFEYIHNELIPLLVPALIFVTESGTRASDNNTQLIYEWQVRQTPTTRLCSPDKILFPFLSTYLLPMQCRILTRNNKQGNLPFLQHSNIFNRLTNQRRGTKGI